MKKIALLISVLAILSGCAELPSASKPSLVTGETTARPEAQDKVAASKGSLVPASKPAAATYKGLFEERRAVRVGDTLTVMLNETTRASKDIGTNARRMSSNGVNAGFNMNTGSASTCPEPAAMKSASACWIGVTATKVTNWCTRRNSRVNAGGATQ